MVERIHLLTIKPKKMRFFKKIAKKALHTELKTLYLTVF